jgi:hypothetical protein
MVELSVPAEPQSPPEITLDKVQSALRLPVGVASPLWFMFAGAATAGMAYWWMIRWARPQNLEAMMTAPPTLTPEPEAYVWADPVLPPIEEPRSFAAETDDVTPILADPAPEPVVAPEPPPVATAAAIVPEALPEPLTGAALVAEVARLTGLAPPETMPDFEPEPKAPKKSAKKPPPAN